MDFSLLTWVLISLVQGNIKSIFCERSCRNGLPTKPYPATVKNTTLLLAELRKLMKDNDVEGYLIPSSDDHRTEYVSERDKRRQFISGFKGSAGTALVTDTKAVVWVDGRYHEQVDLEVDCNWTPMKSGLTNVSLMSDWAKEELAGKTIGVDPRVISLKLKQDLMKKWKEIVTWKNIDDNLVDKVWIDRPKPSHNKIFVHDLKYAGVTYSEKLDNLRAKLKKSGTKAIIVQALDDVAWLLNLRGNDISYIPFFYGYIIVTMENVTLYVDLKKVDDQVRAHLNGNYTEKYRVEIKDYDYAILGDDIKALVKNNTDKIWITPKSSVFLGMNIPEDRQYQKYSPIQLPKAMKNKVELEGMKSANIKDSVAIMEYFAWIKEQLNKGNKVTELSGEEQLKKFKSEQEDYRGLSFATIGGFGPNGAIIHYKANNHTNLEITDKSLYLLDCGAQFPEGSTDITRTVHFGTPTAKQKEMYTYVLRGVINLASAVFPSEGTYGRNIDAYARKFLWEKGLDYLHGTGHGIGAFLSIHEGPGRINTGRTYEGESGLYEGMVFSDEPGYYETGNFGIRLETAIYVKPVSTKYTMKSRTFMGFGVLTYVPFARNLIDVSLLSQHDIDWLNKYNADIRKNTGPLIQKQKKNHVYEYMMAETEPYERNTQGNGSDRTFSIYTYFILLMNLITVYLSSLK